MYKGPHFSISSKQMNSTTKQLQFFSKWRNEWIDFKNPPSAEEMKSYKEHEYKIREKKVK